MQIVAVLVGAGMSSRMNGNNKMLLPLKGRSVLAETYENLDEVMIDHTIIVTGRDREEVESCITLRKGDEFVFNENYPSGLTSSIQTGLKNVLQMDAVMICLGDMPLMKPEHYNFLIEAFRSDAESSILVPFYQNQKANPVIFAKQHFPQIMNHEQPNGCSAIVRSNLRHVQRVDVSSDTYVKDIDTITDYHSILNEFK